ncbi:MAG: hypothetical protein K6A23_07190, partial [Butyrivibrio sp.]|nr:hypothetical protein [Butyrivibrio sp.]
MNKNKIIIPIFLLSIIICFIIIIKLFYNPKETNDSENEYADPIIDTFTDYNSEYFEELKNESSDLEGLTKYDKYLMHLNPADDSDSDGDGLTDKEEIEIYFSDPLKISTSGDLYEDGYKVANNMDLNTYYEYNDELIYKWNQCDELMFSATTADDLYASSSNITGSIPAISNYTIAEYRINNYSGVLSIDISEIIDNPDDVSVLLSSPEDLELKNISFETDENIIKLNYNFDRNYLYELHIVQKENSDKVISLYNASELSKSSSSNEARPGSGIIFGNPFLGLFKQLNFQIWVEDIGSYTDYEKQALIDEINYNWVSYPEVRITSLDDERISIKSKEEISDKYDFYRKFIPFLEYTSDESINFLHLFFSYKTLDNEKRYDKLLNTPDENNESETPSTGKVVVTTDFDIYEDELPFANFSSIYSPGGNCAGISYLTSTLFNNKQAPGLGSDYILAHYKPTKDIKILYEMGNVEWNVAAFEDTITLTNPILSDFKDRNFLSVNDFAYLLSSETENYTFYAPNYNSLSESEQNFVDMIGCYQQLANSVSIPVCSPGISNYSYNTIEKMKEYINNGKILNVGCNVITDGGHMVNVYGYEYNISDPDKTIFYVYDSNLPNADNNICKLIVTKCYSLVGYSETFTFDYYPISDNQEYRLTSYVDSKSHYWFLVLDDNLN